MTIAESAADEPADSQSTSDWKSDRSRFQTSPESEARLLLLIDQFSRTPRGGKRYLEGRLKLTKLDFLLRYPHHLERILLAHGIEPQELRDLDAGEGPLDARMMRYRYGPWDPAHFAILGSLIGRGLVEVAALPGRAGFGYRTSDRGAQLAQGLNDDDSFLRMSWRLRLLRKHLDKPGNTLKNYLYELPEVADASWGDDLE
jgi:hypothetical protein